MKLDTSSYYPKSPLGDEPDPDHSAYMPGHASDPEPEGSEQHSPEQPDSLTSAEPFSSRPKAWIPPLPRTFLPPVRSSSPTTSPPPCPGS